MATSPSQQLHHQQENEHVDRIDCINEALTDDELRSVLSRLESDKDKEIFGLVCKRWLHLQSTERKKLCARAGTHMLQKMAARFTRVVELDLSQSVARSFYPGVSNADLDVVAKGFQCLLVLNLQNCKGITDSGMVAIGSLLSSLQSLDVSYCRKLTDNGLFSIAEGCTDIRSLSLTGCKYVTDLSLESLSRNCRNLEELRLQGCSNITDAGLKALVNGCRKIKLLDINKCSNVSDVGILSVSHACSSNLRTLKLLDCYKVGDDSIFSLARFCTNLETLIIGGCRDISDESMKSLAQSCRQSLKNLRMDWCLNISDDSLKCILSLCKNLEALDIGCCEEVTDAGFELLKNDGSELGLKILRVSNCPKITILTIGRLLDTCKTLTYLDVRSCPWVTKLHCVEAGLYFPALCKVNFNGSLSEPDILL